MISIRIDCHTHFEVHFITIVIISYGKNKLQKMLYNKNIFPLCHNLKVTKKLRQNMHELII